MRDGQQQLDEGLQGIVQGVIAVQPEDAEVDVVAAQHGLQHGEAHADALQLHAVHLILRHLAQRQDAIPLMTATRPGRQVSGGLVKGTTGKLRADGRGERRTVRGDHLAGFSEEEDAVRRRHVKL